MQLLEHLPILLDMFTIAFFISGDTASPTAGKELRIPPI
jgi:hypothetical protein